MRKILSVLAAAAVLALPAAPSQAASIGFSPSATSTTIGGTVDIDIVVTGLDAIAEIVSGFDLNVLFNQAIADASAAGFNLAAFGGAGNTLSGFVDGAGNAGLDLISLLTDAELDALQGDTVTLATLTFTGVANGATLLAFGPDADFDRNVLGRNGLSLQLTFGTACIAVGNAICTNRIPEPGSVALLAIGILGWIASRRRIGSRA